MGDKVYNVKILADRFKGVETEFRHDLVIRHIGELLINKAQKNPNALIAQSEIQELYDNLIGLDPSSNFRKVFGDLIEELSKERKTTKEHEAGNDITRTLAGRVPAIIPQAKEVAEKPRAFSKDELVIAIGKAQAGFDHSIIENACKVVESELQQLQISNPRTRALEISENKILVEACFIVPQGNVKVLVPVEVKNGSVLYPTKFYCGEKKFELSVQGMKEYGESLTPEDTVPQYDGSMLEMTYNDVRKAMHTAIFNKDYVKAKETLQIVQDKWPQNFAATFEDFQHWLKQASTDVATKCAGCSYKMIKTASIHPMCGRYNVPAYKVVKDASGICSLPSIDFDRMRDESYKGAFNTSQILFPKE